MCKASRVGSLVGVFLRLLAVFYYIALLEEDILHGDAPLRLAAQQKLQVHAKVLDLFLLRVAHDGAGVPILFDGYALLVPVYGLVLFYERSYHARKGAYFVG